MIKRAFLIGIYSIMLSSLLAETYSSNAIGQKLGKYSENNEYYLIEEVLNSKVINKLYKNNQLIEIKEIANKDNLKIVTTTRSNNTAIKTFKDDKIIKETNNDLNILYSYDKELISSKTVSNKDETLKIYKYLYDNYDKLSAILEIENNQIKTKYFSYSSNNLSILLYDNNLNQYIESRINDGIINSSEYKNNELINNIEIEKQNKDEIILVKKDNNSKEKEYYKNGLLIKKENYNNDLLIKSIEYDYDNNFFLKKEKIEEKSINNYTKEYTNIKTTLNFFNDGILEKTILYENKIIVSEITYNDNIKIENLYDNGMLYCTITLDNDKIKDIQYREVNDDL